MTAGDDQRVRITEVGPRDGLQNEPAVVPVEDKVEFVDLLSQSGVAEIEVTSFVSPRWVPQLADAQQVLAGIRRAAGVVYSALVRIRELTYYYLVRYHFYAPTYYKARRRTRWFLCHQESIDTNERKAPSD